LSGSAKEIDEPRKGRRFWKVTEGEAKVLWRDNDASSKSKVSSRKAMLGLARSVMSVAVDAAMEKSVLVRRELKSEAQLSVVSRL
jgi:hypothetical protein